MRICRRRRDGHEPICNDITLCRYVLIQPRLLALQLCNARMQVLHIPLRALHVRTRSRLHTLHEELLLRKHARGRRDLLLQGGDK